MIRTLYSLTFIYFLTISLSLSIPFLSLLLNGYLQFCDIIQSSIAIFCWLFHFLYTYFLMILVIDIYHYDNYCSFFQSPSMISPISYSPPLFTTLLYSDTCNLYDLLLYHIVDNLIYYTETWHIGYGCNEMYGVGYHLITMSCYFLVRGSSSYWFIIFML